MWEGEDQPTASPDDAVAFRAYSLLSNGMGGIDWAGLPLVCEWLGVSDVDGLLHRLSVIKAHKPPEENKD